MSKWVHQDRGADDRGGHALEYPRGQVERPASHDVGAIIDARYRRLFGYRAGYLPRDRRQIDVWHRNLKEQLREGSPTRERSPAVRRLAELLDTNAIVRMYVAEMIDQVPSAHKAIENIEELLAALDQITVTAPAYNQDPNKRNAFPMSALFTYMMMTGAGEAVFRNAEFNSALKDILQEWCRYLDSAESADVLNEGEYGGCRRSRIRT